MSPPDAIVLAEGVFATTSGKTANGLVRYCTKYRVRAVVDSRHAGKDAGQVLDGKANGVPVFASIADAHQANPGAKALLVGIAPDGGKLPPSFEPLLLDAVRRGLDVWMGLHDYLNDRPELVAEAKRHDVRLHDVRRPKAESEMHFFTGEIETVQSYRLAVLGTDSAIGKRTTARLVTNRLNEMGVKTEFIGTGQTAMLQGTRYGIVLDSLVNDYVTGEIEHAVVRAWKEVQPRVVVLEGQGALTHPAYPGGFELIAAGRPDGIVLQHAPGRVALDGFEQYPMPDLRREIQLLELLAQKPVIALALNHENLSRDEVDGWVARYEKEFGLPTCDPLWHGPDKLARVIARETFRKEARLVPGWQNQSRPCLACEGSGFVLTVKETHGPIGRADHKKCPKCMGLGRLVVWA